MHFQTGLERGAESESIDTYFSTMKVKINILRTFRGILEPLFACGQGSVD